MGYYAINETTLQDVANAIREKDGTSESIVVSDMADKIKDMQFVPKKPYVDSKCIKNWSYWFADGGKVGTENFIDTRNGEIFDYFFSNTTIENDFPDGHPIDKIDTSKGVSHEGFFRGCVDITELTELPDTSNSENMKEYFAGCSKLVSIPQNLNTSKNKNFYGMCYSCNKLKYFPETDTSKGVTFGAMFWGDYELEVIEKLDLSSCDDTTATTGFFFQCRSLITIGEINWGNFIPASSAFNNTLALTNINVVGTMRVENNYWKFNYSDNLTVESILSILNALEDKTGGETYTVYFGPTNLAKLTTEQKQIAINKNIKLA